VSRAARGPSPVSGALTRAQRPASVQLSLNAAAQKRRRSGLSVHSTKRVSPGLGWAHTVHRFWRARARARVCVCVGGVDSERMLQNPCVLKGPLT